MIELKNIHKEFDGNVILENVSATINEGDVVAIIGPSGCGKSTFLNCINLLKPATSGEVIFDGVDLMQKGLDLKPFRKRIGMVFQSYNLFEHLTVIENVINPQVTLLGRTRQEAYEKAMEYLTLVGMADRSFRYPDALSGGQKQRVAIARTLAMDPEVILLDEPTSALDPTMVGEVEYVIKKLADQGRTMIIVTHEMRFARLISNRLFFMEDKGIYEAGPTEEIFTNPKRDKTRKFINRVRVLEINIDTKYFDYVDAITKIMEFCARFYLSSQKTNTAQLLFEETCVQRLIPDMTIGQNIKAVFEYTETTGELTYKLYHPGKAILNDVDADFQQKLIDNLVREIPTQEILTDQA